MTSSDINAAGLSRWALNTPIGIHLSGSTLFIADSGNHRILVMDEGDI